MVVWIFANGEIKKEEWIVGQIPSGSMIIAADGGLHHIQNLHLVPHAVVGDLDSISLQDLKWLSERNVPVFKHPPEKDATDLELAVFHALKSKPQKIRIAGATGGRIDQTLGNIFLLMLPELGDIDVKLVDGSDEIFLIRQEVAIHGSKGDLVSLLPLVGSAKKVSTSGLKYPLSEETLLVERTRGISNVMQGEYASVQLAEGILLCIHTKKKLRKGENQK